jgi:hypothetical protein
MNDDFMITIVMDIGKTKNQHQVNPDTDHFLLLSLLYTHCCMSARKMGEIRETRRREGVKRWKRMKGLRGFAHI